MIGLPGNEIGSRASWFLQNFIHFGSSGVICFGRLNVREERLSFRAFMLFGCTVRGSKLLDIKLIKLVLLLTGRDKDFFQYKPGTKKFANLQSFLARILARSCKPLL